MIHLSMEFRTTADFNRFLADPLNYAEAPLDNVIQFPGTSVAQVTGAAAAQAVTNTAAAAEPEKRKPGRPKKDVASNAQPEVASNPGSSSAGSQEASPPADGTGVEGAASEAKPDAAPSVVTLDDVREELTQVNLALGMPAAKQLLHDHGATRISDLAADKYPAFVAAARELVANAPKAA